MTAEGSGLVEIVREFLVAHRLLRQVAARYRGGLLAFDEVGVANERRVVLTDHLALLDLVMAQLTTSFE
jgi:hypothetical protein